MTNCVVPNLDSVPERIYLRSGSVVKCYRYRASFDVGLSDFIFEITFGDESEAVILMEDLYYGEYTGA